MVYSLSRSRWQPQNENDLNIEDNLKNKDDLKDKDDLKNKVDLKNEDNLKKEDDIKNENDLKKEDDRKKEYYLKLILNRKCYQVSEPEIVLRMTNIIYTALPMRTQTQKTTFSCKDDCTLTKHTRRWTYSGLRYF